MTGGVEHDDVAMLPVRLEFTPRGAERMQSGLRIFDVVDGQFEMHLHRNVLARPGRRSEVVDTAHKDQRSAGYMDPGALAVVMADLAPNAAA
jgi:hypothetical protein